MYSRNMHDRQDSFTVPPGYDGSRFRRRRRRSGDGSEEIELVPDSGFASSVEPDTVSETNDGELSVGGIPTERGRRYSASAEIIPPDTELHSQIIDDHCDKTEKAPSDRLSHIFDKLGFGDGFSSDELLLIALIFVIASDRADDSRDAGDILLILALLLGLR